MQEKIKILCVEDELDIRESICEILRDEGFEVFEAGDGKSGLDIFIRNNPDLVISDIMMPGSDGFYLLKSIREGKEIRNNSVPFIFLSALGQKDNILKGIDNSANDYLVKPIDFDYLIAKIKEKTANANLVKEFYNRNISNIKHQVSEVLPQELYSYLDIITQTARILKTQPYGPLPHRSYLEDIEKIFLYSLKLRSAIHINLDSDVIDQKINAHEEIFAIYELFDEFISALSSKVQSRINIEKPYRSGDLPKVKLDKAIIINSLKKIFIGFLTFDPESHLKISFMIDHFKQIVVIFYLQSNLKNLSENINEKEISKILDNQSCRFEIVLNKENTAVLTIPSFRLIN